MTDSLHTLSDHHPDLRVHAPRLAGDVGPLLSEAKIARAHAAPREAGGLDLDLANLADGVAGLVALLRAGVSTEDVAEAEGNLRVLALNLRQDCARIISERGREIRLDTEAAVLRKRQDIEKVDVSDGFRAIFAEPAAPLGGGFIAEMSLPLPEAGGPIGRVIGLVRTFRLAKTDKTDTGSAVTADEPVFLPEGTEIVLRNGETVLIRHAGLALDRALNIRDFTPDQAPLAVQAKEDGVRITGPAVLSQYVGTTPEGLQTAAATLREALATTSVFRTEGFCGAASLCVGLSSMFASVMAFEYTNMLAGSTLSAVSILGIAGMAALPNVFKKDSRLRTAGLNVLEEAVSKNGTDWDIAKAKVALDIARAKVALDGAQEQLSEAREVRFYAARKVMTRDKAGPRVLRPTLSLVAPVRADFTPESVKEIAR